MRSTGVSRIRWRRPPQDGRGTCGKEAHGSSTTTDDEETETNQPEKGQEPTVENGRVEKGAVERAGFPKARSQEISFSKSGGRAAGSDRSDVRSASSASSNAPPVLGSNRRVCRLYRRREGAYQAAGSAGDDSRPGTQNLVESPAGTRVRRGRAESWPGDFYEKRKSHPATFPLLHVRPLPAIPFPGIEDVLRVAVATYRDASVQHHPAAMLVVRQSR